MKETFIILLLIICFYGCNDNEFSNDVLSFDTLKIYDLDIIKVKKVHDEYALINLSKVLFINKSGNKTFDFDSKSYIKDNNISFRFTDVVEGENESIYILASELLDDNTFSIYVFKIDSKGMPIWDSPKIFPITDKFENTLSLFNRNKNQYYGILDNGYVLGKMLDDRLILAINYQKGNNEFWRYHLISINYDGEVLKYNDFKSTSQPQNWTYILDQLPNNNLVLVQGSLFSCFINQYDPISLANVNSYSINGINSSPLNYITLTNMLTISASTVLFTGHADRVNNATKNGNFDIFYLGFDVLDKTVVDSIYTGEVDNFELVFYSFIDDNNVVKCIGAKRQALISTQNSASSLFMSSLDMKTGKIDSTFIITNQGYEGLFVEKTNNNELTIIGSKIDISGKDNKQAFFTILKTNDYE